jgi:hypothetical protein
MQDVNCPECGHANFYGRRLCEMCNTPLRTLYVAAEQLQSDAVPVEQQQMANAAVYGQTTIGAARVLPIRQILGLAGSVVLFLGVFAPIISAPVIGSVNYFKNGTGDGVIIIILAALSAFFSLREEYRGLIITGLLSIATLIFTFVMFRTRLSGLQEEIRLASRYDTSVFGKLGETFVNSIQLEWGWAVLVIGAVLLLSAAFIRSDATKFGVTSA